MELLAEFSVQKKTDSEKNLSLKLVILRYK